MRRPGLWATLLTIGALASALAGCMAEMDDSNGGPMNNGGGPAGPGPVVTTGIISGTVSAGNSGVPGAQIALGSGGSTTTAASGQYTFGNVASGAQSLTLTSPGGFGLAAGETSTKSTSVVADQTSTVNWTLVPSVAPPKTIDVSLDASRFRPPDVTIARGDTVRWVNAQPIAHNITPDSRTMPGVWRTQNIPARPGYTFSHTFESSGNFTYRCTLHIGMTGVVRVP